MVNEVVNEVVAKVVARVAPTIKVPGSGSSALFTSNTPVTPDGTQGDWVDCADWVDCDDGPIGPIG